MRGDLPLNARAAVAELVGTALLLVAVVGSGIMAERLCGGNAGLALLANAVATGGALVALILAFGPVSGAHFNPVVTLADAARGGLPWRDVPPYLGAQFAGALAGVAIANLTFGLPAFSASHHVRAGTGLFVSEIVATFGLLAVVWGVRRSWAGAAPFAIASYIVGAYWFTPSTSFANPAVTLARSLATRSPASGPTTSRRSCWRSSSGERSRRRSSPGSRRARTSPPTRVFGGIRASARRCTARSAAGEPPRRPAGS